MKYVYAASFLHESNTFSDHISDLDWFQKRCWKFGDEVLERFRGVKTEFGGFIDAMAQWEDIELVPVIAAEATPSGPVAADVAKRVQTVIVDALRHAGQIDAVLLSLHGAMVTEDSEDGEGDLLEAIRAVVGSDVPVYATLDLHANMTEKMAANADVFIPYDCYPHTDKYERGMQAAQLLARALHGEIQPCMETVKLPFLFPLVGTGAAVMESVVRMIAELEQESGVLNVSVTHGFISADIREGGVSVQAVTDGDREKAVLAARRVARDIWEKRAEFSAGYLSVEEAVRAAMYARKRPFIISDGPDNPGGGSFADGTLVLRALMEAGVRSAVVALIYDAESVERCVAAGEGQIAALSLGGKLAPASLGEPVCCEARVLKLTDGRYRNHGPMNQGLQMDLIATALIDVNGIRVIVVKNPTQPYDFGLMELHGIDPRKEEIIVLKSAVHFTGAYGPIAGEIVYASYPAICVLSPRDAELVKCKRPIYPLDEGVEFAI